MHVPNPSGKDVDQVGLTCGLGVCNIGVQRPMRSGKLGSDNKVHSGYVTFVFFCGQSLVEDISLYLRTLLCP